jgi:hypothetical protein
MRLIGRREFVSFPLLGIGPVEAKIDTGAYTSALHCEEIILKNNGSSPVLYFTVLANPADPTSKLEFNFDEFSTKSIKNSFGETEERFIIRTVLKIGRKSIRASISLTDRGTMRYPILIGRKPLKGKFLIDVNQLHLGGPKAGKALKKILL